MLPVCWTSRNGLSLSLLVAAGLVKRSAGERGEAQPLLSRSLLLGRGAAEWQGQCVA